MIGRSKTSVVFDISWFISFIVIESLPFIVPDTMQHPLGFFAISFLIGGCMIFSKKLKDASIVGKMLHWIAINVMKPRSEYNHIIWGLFILILGVLSLIFSSRPSENEIDFFRQVQSSSRFWFGIIAVLAFNILVGVYTVRKYKKD